MNGMKIIPTRIHGVIDYLMGLLLIVLPRIRTYDGNLTMWLTILGVGMIVISLITDYELSIAKLIPMPVHLGIDVLMGLALIVLPFLLGVGTSAPLIVLGLGEIVIAALTQTHSSMSGRVTV